MRHCEGCGAYQDAPGCVLRVVEVEQGTLGDCWRPEGTVLVWDERSE